MANIDYVVEWFFQGYEITDPKVVSFRELHWEGTGCQWVVQRSSGVAYALALLSQRVGPEVAVESLQIALNDLIYGKISVIDEDGVMAPVVIARLDNILASLPDAEPFIISFLNEF